MGIPLKKQAAFKRIMNSLIGTLGEVVNSCIPVLDTKDYFPPISI